MDYMDKTAENPSEIVELFADYFESVYVKDNLEIDFDEMYGEELEDVFEINLSMLDIESAIKN